MVIASPRSPITSVLLLNFHVEVCQTGETPDPIVFNHVDPRPIVDIAQMKAAPVLADGFCRPFSNCRKTAASIKRADLGNGDFANVAGSCCRPPLQRDPVGPFQFG